MANEWKRPESVPFPSVWSIVNGKKPMGRNGQIPRFRIQDATEDLHEQILQHMCTHFLRDEPYTSILNIADNALALQEISEIWKTVLKKRCVLVALLDNLEEIEDETLPRLAGCNMTFPSLKGDKDPEVTSPELKSIFGVINESSHSIDVYERYNVDKQMYALGLSVDPTYRGQGLGEEIVKARFPLGKAVGLPLTTTVFTGIASQTIGRKNGFELLNELSPQEYKENGVEVFKGVKSKSIQFQACLIK